MEPGPEAVKKNTRGVDKTGRSWFKNDSRPKNVRRVEKI